MLLNNNRDSSKNFKKLVRFFLEDQNFQNSGLLNAAPN